MKVLLDTQAFLWFIIGDEQLSQPARAEIENEENDLYISSASLWEMAIKVSLGKLTLTEPLETLITEQLETNGIGVLGITIPHVTKVSSLPFHHRDPFDRLIISQGLVENMPIISVDDVFDDYGVKRIW